MITHPDYMAVLNEEGQVYTWGENCFGQLGDGGGGRRSTPVLLGGELAGKRVTQVQLRNNATYVLTEEGQIYFFGGNNFSYRYMSVNRTKLIFDGELLNKKVIQFERRTDYLIAVSEDGFCLYTWIY
jgi:alpha-tubulin suppressor-like RCC1 family protein